MSQNTRNGKVRKEAYFVQLQSPDKSLTFVNVSAQLGRRLTVTKPLATAMLRVREDAILFSALKLYDRVRTKLTSTPLSMQPGPLARLERRIGTVEAPLTDEQLLVELDDERFEFKMTRDENNVVSLDHVGEGEPKNFELPTSPLQLTMYLTSPRTKRLMVIGWVGYQNKPGLPETLERAAAFALNHLTGLDEFALLAGIASVTVPAAPGRYKIVSPTRKAADRVQVVVPVRMWDGDAAPNLLGAGNVTVNVDLDTISGRELLFHTSPEPGIAELFPAYRPVMVRALGEAYLSFFGDDELEGLRAAITLGELGEGDLGRLRDAAATITGYDMNPTLAVKYDPNA